MAKRFFYTTLALRYTSRYPLLSHVGTQINFWILAHLLLIFILRIQSRIISQAYHEHLPPFHGSLILMAVLAGVFYGTIHGLASYYLDRKLLSNLSMGRAVLIKAAASIVVLLTVLPVMKYFWFDHFFSSTHPLSQPLLNETSFKLTFFIYVIFYFSVSLLINFVHQINKRYGAGILLPLLLGRYRTPQEEERIFVFMDLKSSTYYAERLGHLRYSAFIRDCFADINLVLYPHRAQVYQYVGDEIVVTWQEEEGLKQHFCIAFFFACREQFQRKSQYYMKEYGFLPEFKASAHSGMVTAVEIGDHKREIAYHGDTLNTAARIQSVCNELNKSFIVSQHLVDKLGPHPRMQVQSLGNVLLKGKGEEIHLFGLNWQ